MSEPVLLSERIDGILIVTLNRPAKLNAMNAEVLSLLDRAIEEFRDSDALRVLLIRAKGRYFCAGADVIEGETMSFERGSGIRLAHRRGIGGVQRMWDELEAIEKPVVVAHHAACVGGGLEMSLSCDFRLAAASASYSFPEAVFGSLPASGGVSRLTRIIGAAMAKYLVMANKPVDAQRALQIGLVHEVFPDDAFAEQTMVFCRHLAAQLPEAMGMAKLAIDLAQDVQAAQGRNVERLANSALLMGREFSEALAALRSRMARGEATAEAAPHN
jgi:enoyl-CoA hydratase